jgi:hypothetical protein
MHVLWNPLVIINNKNISEEIKYLFTVFLLFQSFQWCHSQLPSFRTSTAGRTTIRIVQSFCNRGGQIYWTSEPRRIGFKFREPQTDDDCTAQVFNSVDLFMFSKYVKNWLTNIFLREPQWRFKRVACGSRVLVWSRLFYSVELRKSVARRHPFYHISTQK